MAEIKREQLLIAIITGRGPAFLRGVDLSHAELANAGWLMEADLRQANLIGANLSRSNLKNANLEKANLQDCTLIGSNLEGANFREAKLNAALARMANLRGAVFHSARMIGINLSRANLEGANLECADLEGANLEGADLTNAKLDLANLRMANLNRANLHGATVDGTVLKKESAPEGLLDSSPGFSGSIHKLQLTDMIQLAALSHSNVLLRVESIHGNGIVNIRSGRVEHAQMGQLQGEAALFEMLGWDSGRFETMPIPNMLNRVTIDKPLEHLLVEGMRQRDERKVNESMKHEPGRA